MIRIAHVSLTARDAPGLAAFYKTVFGFMDRRPPRRLTGLHVGRGNGLPGVDILSLWLTVAGDDGPFLEIMQYDQTAARGLPAVNDPGFGHIALVVPDLHATLDRVLQSGGALQGEVTNFGSPGRPLLIVYVRDPEGNLLELEQPA